jgi:hypothetical protein
MSTPRNRKAYAKNYYRLHRQHILEQGKKRHSQNKKNSEFMLSKCTYSKQYYATHIAEKRNYDLLHRFGITSDQYNRMLDKQNGVCAICGNRETRRIHGKICVLSVDHSHVTGRVRGLLCNRCNKVLGIMDENTNLFQRIVSYLNVSHQ